MTIPFTTIRSRAEKRKGGPRRWAAAAAETGSEGAHQAGRRSRARGNQPAGVLRRLRVERDRGKWSGFEKAFLGFDPGKLTFQPDEFWDRLMRDTRIVRYGAKIMSVRDNAGFIREVARDYGSFGGCWRHGRPPIRSDCSTAGQARQPARRQQRPDAVRFLGWDGPSRRATWWRLRDAGLDIAETVTSKRDLAKVQAQFNAWAEETGLPYTHLSRICAMSIGENMAPRRSRGSSIGGGWSLNT